MTENFPTDDAATLGDFPNFNDFYGGLFHKEEISFHKNEENLSSAIIILLNNKNVIPCSIVGIINNVNNLTIEKFTSSNKEIIFQSQNFTGKINNKLGIIELPPCFPKCGIYKIIIEYETYR